MTNVYLKTVMAVNPVPVMCSDFEKDNVND
jgi:hypothetical protein